MRFLKLPDNFVFIFIDFKICKHRDVALVSRSLLIQCCVVPQYFCLCNAVWFHNIQNIGICLYHWVLLWLIFKTSSEKQLFLESSKSMYVKCLYLVFHRSIWSNTELIEVGHDYIYRVYHLPLKHAYSLLDK